MNDDQSSEKVFGQQHGKWHGKKMDAGSGHAGPSPRLIVVGVLAALITIFIVRNDHAVRINFLLFSWDTTVRWSLFIAILLGVVLDRLLIWGLGRRKQHEHDVKQNDKKDDKKNDQQDDN